MRRFLFVALMLTAACSQASRAQKVLTAEHLAAIDAAHDSHAWIKPNKVELSPQGFVVVEYEIGPGFLIPPRTLGQERLLGIREALLPFGFEDYRVNINGPPPGTGLTRRFGSARFIGAGGKLEWLTP